jgi:hypothetical protein
MRIIQIKEKISQEQETKKYKKNGKKVWKN